MVQQQRVSDYVAVEVAAVAATTARRRKAREIESLQVQATENAGKIGASWHRCAQSQELARGSLSSPPAIRLRGSKPVSQLSGSTLSTNDEAQRGTKK
jgi:hypothetical protein